MSQRLDRKNHAEIIKNVQTPRAPIIFLHNQIYLTFSWFHFVFPHEFNKTAK